MTENTQEIPKIKIEDSHITKYIRENLEKVAINEGFKNFHLDIDYGSKIGDGFVGVILKVKIEDDESDKSLSVLAKVPPENQARREVLKSMEFFEREVFMYNVVLPEFVAFQREKDISKEEGFYNFPKVYLANYTKDDAIIIMEDLRDHDYKNWNKFKPIDYDHARLIMTTLGRFHAVSMTMKLQKPEAFKEFSKMKEIFFRFSTPKSVERLRKMVQKLLEDAPGNEKILQLVDELDKQVLECINPQLAGPFTVITHGDCWTNNFLFHYDKNGQPDDVIIIDWQASRYSSPILDLVYFISNSTDKSMREKFYSNLMNVYHRSLTDLCSYMEADKKSLEFSREDFQNQLRKFGKFGLIMASIVIPITQAKGEDLPDFDAAAEEIKKQNENHTVESKSLFLIKSSNDTVDERIRDLVKDVIAYGYL